MKIGIYGGSFNPVHFGHMGLADWVLSHTDLDEVWMMVSPNNPLKPANILADEQVRLRGVQEAILSHQATYPASKTMRACDFEFHLPRPSYTANTLRELQATYPDHQFCLIIGEDNWQIFHKWREAEYIASHFEIYVYPRHTKDLTPGENCHQNCPKVHFLDGAPYFDISSTEIRARR